VSPLARLWQALRAILPGGDAAEPSDHARGLQDDPARRLEAAHERLKASIPPPED
jgi:hypothetical protein